jgi:hypothetical protein
MEIKYIVRGAATCTKKDKDGNIVWVNGKSTFVRVLDTLEGLENEELIARLEKLVEHNQGVSKQRLEFKHAVELNAIKKGPHTIEVAVQRMRYGKMFIVRYKKV